MALCKKGISSLKKLTSKGTYVLIVELPKDTLITVGKLGTFMFSAGFYGYIGSAHGGLYKRLKRYFSPSKKRRWHIDYLLKEGTIKAIVACESKERIECTIAQRLQQTLAPILGFGVSDCLCLSHLYYHPNERALRGEIIRAFNSCMCSIIEIEA